MIKPSFWADDSPEYSEWLTAMKQVEKAYMKLIDLGASPEQARSVLPDSLKTEIVMTCNIRQWRHVLNLRCAQTAHLQMREIMLPLLKELNRLLPLLFEDIYGKYKDKM